MNVARHQTDGGWWLVERDIDLYGRVLVYGIEDSPWELVRTPTGWRARLAAHGKARRVYRGPGWESAPQAVRYLMKYSYLRPTE